MDSKTEKEVLNGVRTREESIGFSLEEMMTCGSCGKKNSPNRVACLYCAEILDVPDTVRGNLKFRQLESWEKGCNIVIIPDGTTSPEVASRAIANLFSVEAEHIARIFQRGRPFPAARLESDNHAQYVTADLTSRGIRSTTVHDSELANDRPPIRLRGIEFDGDVLILLPINSDQKTRIRGADIELIVTGAILESKTETTHRRKSGKNEALDEFQSSNHEPLIDFYTNGDKGGHRIRSSGFDFSCLSTDKTILAAENLKRLVSKLVSFAPGVRVIDDYCQVRRVLDTIWEPETRKESQGVYRSGMGKINMSNVLTSNNLQQFTKYSRLQRHFL